MGYPESGPACGFADGPPGDPGEVAQQRYRAEAAEWLALFRLYLREADRLSDAVLERAAEYERVQAAEAACARWCVSAPVTVAATRYRLKAAIQLFEHLPLLAQAFLDGRVPGSLVQQIVSRTFEVDPRLCAGVDAAISQMILDELAGGARFSAKAINAMVDEIVMLMDPDAVRTAARAARKQIGVHLENLPGGIARLVAVMPGAAGAIVRARVDALARRIHGERPVDAEGTRLSLGRCRAVALLVAVAGRAALPAAADGADLAGIVDAALTEEADSEQQRANSRAGSVGVMIHATEETVERPSPVVPVWISGLGLLSSEAVAGLLAAARRLAPGPGPLRQVRPDDWLSWVTTPHTRPGRPECEAIADAVPAYALRYRIPDWLKAKVRMRDGHCRFPGCGVPAADCDVDHVRPFLHRDPVSGGWTIEANLGCLCRRHHRLKTHDDWTVTVDQWAVFTFTSPDGAVAHTYPAGPASRIGLAEEFLGDGPADPLTDHVSDSASGHASDPGRVTDLGGRSSVGVAAGRAPGREPAPPVELLDAWALEDIADAELGGWDHLPDCVADGRLSHGYPGPGYSEAA